MKLVSIQIIFILILSSQFLMAEDPAIIEYNSQTKVLQNAASHTVHEVIIAAHYTLLFDYLEHETADRKQLIEMKKLALNTMAAYSFRIDLAEHYRAASTAICLRFMHEFPKSSSDVITVEGLLVDYLIETVPKWDENSTHFRREYLLYIGLTSATDYFNVIVHSSKASLSMPDQFVESSLKDLLIRDVFDALLDSDENNENRMTTIVNQAGENLVPTEDIDAFRESTLGPRESTTMWDGKSMHDIIDEYELMVKDQTQEKFINYFKFLKSVITKYPKVNVEQILFDIMNNFQINRPALGLKFYMTYFIAQYGNSKHFSDEMRSTFSEILNYAERTFTESGDQVGLDQVNKIRSKLGIPVPGSKCDVLSTE